MPFSTPTVSATKAENPTPPRLKRVAAAAPSAIDVRSIRRVRTSSPTTAAAEKPASSVRSRSKNAPICCPEGPLSTPPVSDAYNAMPGGFLHHVMSAHQDFTTEEHRGSQKPPF